MDDSLVAGFAVKKSWICSVLAEKHNETPEITEVFVLGDTVIGYMSAIARLYLKWLKDDPNLPTTVIVKIPSTAGAEAVWKECGHIEEDSKEIDPIHEIMHSTELRTYEIFTRAPPENLRVPLYYGGMPMDSPSPALVMEDIHDSTTIDLVDGFSEDQLYKIVDQVIALHKWSAKNRHNWEKDTYKWDDTDPDGVEFGRSLIGMMEKMLNCVPHLREPFDLLRRNFLDRHSWIGDYSKWTFEDPDNVYAHGDLWAPQILWRNGELAAIVDWALCRAGTRTEDILRILVTCCTVDRRKKMTGPLLEYYANAMELDVAAVEADYRRTLPFTCGMTMFALSMWSHSPVLRQGGSINRERAGEMQRRLVNLIEETAEAHGWK